MNLTGKQRRAVYTTAVIATVAGTLFVASLVSRQFFESGVREHAPVPSLASAEAAKPATSTSFRVAAIEGPIEAFHNERWYVVQAGDLLALTDVIRAPRGSRALLRRGATEIEVREGVDIRLDSLAAETASFGLLRGGNVVANVGGNGESLAITANETRSESRGTARWVVSLAPDGRVSVAASKGEIRFSAKGKEVPVVEGTQSTAMPGEAPGDAERIPEDLLFSVIWPEVERAEATTEITGKVSPASRVMVNGVEATVSRDGSFVTSVPLKVGTNRVKVEAESITGQKRNVDRVIRRAAPGPTLESTGEDLWKR
jgi:hypothetical protein